MAKQKTTTPNNEQMVEDTIDAGVIEESVITAPVAPVVEPEPEEEQLSLVSTKNISLYKIATRQRNMQCGTLVAGHTYPYKGKVQNADGIFYYTGKGYVYADDCIKIQ